MARSGKSVAVVAALALAVLAGCNTHAPAAAYALRSDIPLGHVTLQVAGIEPGEVPTAFDSAPEDRYYEVAVSVAGLPSVEERSDRRDYITNFFEHRVWLVDADGDRYRPTGAEMESVAAYAAGRASEPWWDDRHWVVTFRVPEASRDFTLLLQNPDRQQGQPAAAVVHLGMP